MQEQIVLVVLVETVEEAVLEQWMAPEKRKSRPTDFPLLVAFVVPVAELAAAIAAAELAGT